MDANNRVQKRAVALGIAGANQQEVASGLQPGDRIIIGGLSTFFAIKYPFFILMACHSCLGRPGFVILGFTIFVILSFALAPLLGRAYFPRTDPGQFVISVKAPTGTRIELTDQYIARVEEDVRAVVAPKDLNMIVSNIGVTPDLSAIYTPKSGMHTASR